MSVVVASAGALGGADNERGAFLRAVYAATAVCYGLRGVEMQVVDRRACGRPVIVKCEVDDPVDDVKIEMSTGVSIFVQVKASLTFDFTAGKPFGKAMRQWIAASCATDGVLPPLLLAAERCSEPIMQLSAALDRARDPHAGAMTTDQGKALDKLRTWLRSAGLQPSDVERVLQAGSIVRFDPAMSQDLCVALLDSTVVALGQGRTAVRELTTMCQQKAIRRSGAGMTEWLECLRDALLTLIVDRNGSLAARRLAAMEAVSRYRMRLIAEGEMVSLRGLGVDLPPFEAVDLGNVTSNLSPDPKHRASLDVALRRHGRALLLGPPGSGKSTMLRRLAAIEARRRWSIPVYLDLRRLLDQQSASLDADSAVESLITLTVRGDRFDDRDLVTEDLRSAAAKGTLVVCLDSLDETRAHREAVVDWIRRLADELHPDCDIVVATRSGGYAAAATLGWVELTPRFSLWSRDLPRQILQAFAAHRHRDEQWIKARITWVADRFAKMTDHDADATPLLICALTAFSATADLDDEVSSPEDLVEHLVRQIAERWEQEPNRRGVTFHPSVHGPQLSDILIEALGETAWSIATGVVTATEITATLMKNLHTRHGLPPGVAKATVINVIHFWDEAGLIVLNDSSDVTARSQHVLDVAAGRHISQLAEPECSELFVGRIANAQFHDILACAAALDMVCAAQLTQAALQHGKVESLLTAARGARSGARLTDTLTNALIDALCRADKPDRPDGAYRVLRALERLAVTPTAQAALITTLTDLLPPWQARLWRAHLHGTWKYPDAAVLRRHIIFEGPPPLASEPIHHRDTKGIKAFRWGPPSGGAFNDVMLAAAADLTPGDHELAARLAELTGQVSVITSEQVRAALTAQGHPSPRLNWPDLSGIQIPAGTFLESRANLISELAGCAPGPPPLAPRNRRRLPNLSALYRFTRADEVGFAAIEREHDTFRKVLSIAISLSGIDTAQLAAEAAFCAAALPDDVDHLFDVFRYEPP